MSLSREQIEGLLRETTPQKGHSWVHCFFRRDKQYGQSTCWGSKGERIFVIEEERNPNAENDYQFYAAAPALARQLLSTLEELEEVRGEVERLRLSESYWRDRFVAVSALEV